MLFHPADGYAVSALSLDHTLMRFAYSTNAYTGFGLAEAVERIAALGYDAVEILCDRPHWFPSPESDAEPRPAAGVLAERLDALGLTVSNLNCNTAAGLFDPRPPESCFEPSLSSANRDWREWRIGYSIRALELARVLAARNISVTSGMPGSGGTPGQGLDLFVDSLCRLCEAAERQDVNIGIEYEPGLLVERAAELAKVIERVGSPRLGANLDIGHSWLDGESPETAVSVLAGRIWNIHVEDIHARKHYHLVPGDGDLPFARYFAALRAAGYRGFQTVELYTCADRPDEAGRQALAFLRTLAGASA